MNLAHLLKLDEGSIARLSEAELSEVMRDLLETQAADRRENQLLYYRPASPRAALVHQSQARIVAIFGGNGSSKTETALAEIIALATGVFPHSIAAGLKPKFRGPVNCRVVVESFTTTLEAVILPKLMWWKWTGQTGDIGGDKGHWGWVPKTSLKGGEWDKAYSNKLHVLTVICRDPDEPEKVLGESTIQFMSKDQDPSDFASGDFHHILHDEPPPLAIWRENEARTMRVGGRLYLSMTWPDDPSIPVEWIHDEIYEKGTDGPNKTKGVECFELVTTENVTLDQRAVAAQMADWSEETKKVRIYGGSLRFSNRIHPLFTDRPLWWSFPAGKVIEPEDGKCPVTNSTDIAEFCHVDEHLEISHRWPSIWVIDPHPRKPHMWLWAQVDPNDDIAVVAEGELDGDVGEVREHVYRTEESYGMQIALRLIDPNMGRSPASTVRGWTWQDAFASVGLNCVLADDSGVGRKTVNEYLKPDTRLLKSRLVIHPRCRNTIHQMNRYTWDNYRRQDERDVKQEPRKKNDDYPTLLKYLMNSQPSFRILQTGGDVVSRYRSHADRAAVRVR